MLRKFREDRRGFIKLCLGAVSASNVSYAFSDFTQPVHNYNQSTLVDFRMKPIVSQDIKVGKAYIFHYPYVTTPCFLIDLGEPVRESVTLKTKEGHSYSWKGGVGPDQSIVAFSAICAHKMTHPAKSVSFINYKHGKVSYRDMNHEPKIGSNLIYCCSERSVYDVSRGASVLGGPANQPLTAILLDYDKRTRSLTAVGTLGGEMYTSFFEKFKDRLQLEYQISEVEKLANAHTEVMLLENFSKSQRSCA